MHVSLSTTAQAGDGSNDGPGVDRVNGSMFTTIDPVLETLITLLEGTKASPPPPPVTTKPTTKKKTTPTTVTSPSTTASPKTSKSSRTTTKAMTTTEPAYCRGELMDFTTSPSLGMYDVETTHVTGVLFYFHCPDFPSYYNMISITAPRLTILFLRVTVSHRLCLLFLCLVVMRPSIDHPLFRVPGIPDSLHYN